MVRTKDITGKRFGSLVAVERTLEKKSGSYLWLCKCECGNETLASVSALNGGLKKSCGCLKSPSQKQNLSRKPVENFYKEGTYLFNLSGKVTKQNKSGIRGVSWNKSNKKWEAHLTFKNKMVLHKLFINKQDAINARKEAEETYFKPILEKYGKGEESK